MLSLDEPASLSLVEVASGSLPPPHAVSASEETRAAVANIMLRRFISALLWGWCGTAVNSISWATDSLGWS
ncbi:hypothetical protein Kisp02_44900 [Kineosporia sp. NBRC 101731]|nr:hypothetical protein Kisp02_44900 [Kineosporia sp. NBRC 101731]